MSEAVTNITAKEQFLGNFSPQRGFLTGPQQRVSTGYDGGYVPASQLAGVDEVQLQGKEPKAAEAPKKSLSIGEMAMNFIKGATVDTVKQIFEQLTTLPGLVMTGLAIGAIALIGGPAALALGAIGILFLLLNALKSGGALISAVANGDGEQANEASRSMGNVVANFFLVAEGIFRSVKSGAPVTVGGKTLHLDPELAKADLTPWESLKVMFQSLIGKAEYVEEGTGATKMPLHKVLLEAGTEQASAKYKAVRGTFQKRWPSGLKRSGMALEGATEVEKLKSFLTLAMEDESVSPKLRARLKAKDLGTLEEKDLEALAQEVERNSNLHVQSQKGALQGATEPVKGSDAIPIKKNLFNEIEKRKFDATEAQDLKTYIQTEDLTPSSYQAIRKQIEAKEWLNATDAETFKTPVAEHNKLMKAHQETTGTAIKGQLDALEKAEAFKEIPANVRTALKGKASSVQAFQEQLGNYQKAQNTLQTKLTGLGVKPEVAKEIVLKPEVAQQSNLEAQLDQALNSLKTQYPNTPFDQLSVNQVKTGLVQGEVPVQVNPFAKSYYEARKIEQRVPGSLAITAGTVDSFMGLLGVPTEGPEEAPAH